MPAQIRILKEGEEAPEALAKPPTPIRVLPPEEQEPQDLSFNPREAFFSSLKDATREVTDLGVGEAAVNVGKAMLGTGEFIVDMATDLGGALQGLAIARLASITGKGDSEEEDERRIADGIPGFSASSRRFLEKVPLFVEGFRERTRRQPAFEGGKAVEQFIGAGFGELQRLDKSIAEFVFEKVKASVVPGAAPAAAAIGRISLEGIAMFAPFAGARRGAKAEIDAAFERNLERQSKGEAFETFNRDVIGTEDKAFTFQEMATEDVVNIIRPDQIRMLNGKPVVQRLDGKPSTEPVTLIRAGDVLSIVSGAEDAIVAQVLGEETVPVKIIERSMTKGRMEALASKVDTMFSRTRKRMEALDKKAKKSIITQLAEASFDSQFGIKRRLVKEAGVAGQNAVQQLTLLEGASSAARLAAQRSIEPVFGGLNKAKTALLDEIITGRRVIDIDRVRGIGKTKHPEGLNSIHHQAKLTLLKDQLGSEGFAELNARADAFFEIPKTLLKMLRKEGLLTEESFGRLIGNDYLPRQYLENFDPVTIETLKGKEISIGESGVEYMRGGSTSLADINARDLGLELIFRTHQRIFKNRVNKSLAQVARDVPGQSIVSEITMKQAKGLLKKSRGTRSKGVQEGVEVLFFREEGVKKAMAVDPVFAQQWKAMTPEMLSLQVQTLRWASGTPLIKASAVGLNPTFFLTDLPRNIAHMLVATGRSLKGVELYSGTIPIGLAQIARDMGSVALDAAQKGPRFQALAAEGAFPNFLAHIGREAITKDLPSFVRSTGRGFDKIGRAASWINEWSEGMMRMAVAERARTKGLSLTEQAFEARAVIDFGQAGTIGKSIDYFSPFFNPAIQAARSGVTGMIRAPGRAAWLQAQIMAGTGALYLYNNQVNPDGAKQLTDTAMVTGYNMFFSPALSFEDQDGNLIHPYLSIKNENTLMPAAAIANFAMRRYFEGRGPRDPALAILAHALPMTPTTFIPPTMDALIKGVFNKNLWFDKDVWTRDKDIQDFAKFHGEEKRNATPPFYILMAKLAHEKLGTDNSPENARAAVDAIFADHPINRMWSANIEQMFTGLTDRQRRQGPLEALQSQPGVWRVLKFTHPAANAFDDMEEPFKVGPTEQKLMNDRVDNLVSKATNEEITLDELRNGMVALIQGKVDDNEAERVIERTVTRVKVHGIFKNREMSGMLSPAWWVKTGKHNHGDDRAVVFFEHWQRLNASKRRQFESIAKQLTGAGVGLNYWNDAFARKLKALKDQHSNPPGEIDMDLSGVDFQKGRAQNLDN